MDYFNFKNQGLYAESLPVSQLVNEFGTPLYVYSRKTLERHYRVFDEALELHPHRICYSVKANGNLAVLNVLAKLGAGFDIVSGGELARVLAAGGDPNKIVFSGVGKLIWEIEAALKHDIFCFNVESGAELERLNELAKKSGKIANISIRVNPDINVGTHPYISTGLKENKFGVDIVNAQALYGQAARMSNINILGVACHIGSQLTELGPFLVACKKMFALIKTLKTQEGIKIRHIDLGGGLGVRYLNEAPPLPAEYGKALLSLGLDKDLEVIVEPGRVIAANAGILVTRVEYIKRTPHKNFAIVDAAMNDYLRPALYQAEQEIVPVTKRDSATKTERFDVVGPVCETADFLAKDCYLAIQPRDLLAVRTVGAYGFVMSSNYNARPRAAEIMVDGDKAFLIRKREAVEELFINESIVSDVS